MAKRIFDFVCSLTGLIVLSPLFLAVAWWINRKGDGPVFYRAVRVGKDGESFIMYKFRSMVKNANRLGGFSTPADDPRITTFGRFLRKHHIDELPQLINVVLGDMSLVGPRPEVSYFVGLMSREEKDIVLSVRPGITDLATLWNSNEAERLKGSPNPDKTYLEKIMPTKRKLQIEYIKRRSFWLDLKIILGTLMRLI